MIKMLIVGRRRADITRSEMQHHMLAVHGKMVVDFIGKQPEQAPKRYAQNHVIDSTHGAGSPDARPWALDRDFVTQVWFDSLPSAMASLEQPFYKEQLRPDEDNFVEQDTVIKFPVQEVVVVSTDIAPSPYKLFVVLNRAPGGTADDFIETVVQVAKAANTGPAAGCIVRHVRNKVMARPNETPVAELVDEYWVKDLSAAQSLAKTLKEAYAGDLTSSENRGCAIVSMLLLAYEHPLFNGVS